MSTENLRFFPPNTPGEPAPAITVIIPVYNGMATLDCCLAAFAAQTFTDFEILLVDDASTDGTKDYCRQRAEGSGRIRWVSLPVNGGQGAARNAALPLAQGRYLYFADADDRVQSGTLERLYHYAQQAQADIVICGYSECSDKAQKIVLPAPAYSPQALLEDRKQLGAPWNKLFRRAFLCEHQIVFPQCRMAEDMAFAAKAMVCAPRIVSCPEALYAYAMHTGNTSHNFARRTEVFVALWDVRQFLRSRGLYARYRRSYWKLVGNFGVRFPMHHFLVLALWQGKQRWKTLCALPRYMAALAMFLYHNYRN